ncbi:S-layer homology domain-containing protein [uncultured Neglectibacter sp.]|uniref:S-layer homology domain-containing protein n=1 Tax=uncultured Neglectibacter sp. TaxID=1924108 RepID=UPI0034DF79BE
MKKMVSLLLALCLIVGCLPLSAGAAEIVGSGACGENVTWTLSDEGVLTISGTGQMEDFSYGNPWALPNEIKTVVIEEGVTSIGKYAFAGCDNLTSIAIPKSLTDIGGVVGNIYSIPNLTDIHVTEGNPEYSSYDGAVYTSDMTKLLVCPKGKKGVYIIPKGVTSIDQSAFSGCQSLTDVVIPEGVTTIPMNTFNWCPSLTSVTFPKTVSHISGGSFEAGIFSGCEKLESLIFEGNAPARSGGVFIMPPNICYIYCSEGSTGWDEDDWWQRFPRKLISELKPKVFAVSVDPVSVQVEKGTTQQFTATVSGLGVFDKNVTWSVTGGTAGTSISSTGLLTVSADEKPNTVLTVTATSVGDKAITDTAAVTIEGDPTDPVVDTTTTPDGSVVTTTTWPDGKKAVHEKSPNGGVKVEVTSATGETITKVDLSADPGEGKKFEDVKENDWFEKSADSATAYGLFQGTSDATFTPNGSMTRGMLAQTLWNLSGKTSYGAGEGTFTDVKDGAWYENAVDWAARVGVTSGTGSGGFSPEQKITREQMVTMLYRYANAIGAPEKSGETLESFPDSGEVSGFAKEAVAWAVTEGVLTGRSSGGKNYIAPQGTATRAEVAAVLTRFVEYLK